MTTKELTDAFKSLPSTSGSEKSVLVKDASGQLQSKPISEFGCTARLSANVGKVLRISNISSVLIATRGSNAERCALIWVSSYNDGTRSRTTAKAIHDNPLMYEWYVNGSSDSNACVYVKLIASANNDTVAVTSIFGGMPMIEIVDALPSDATKLVFS